MFHTQPGIISRRPDSVWNVHLLSGQTVSHSALHSILHLLYDTCYSRLNDRVMEIFHVIGGTEGCGAGFEIHSMSFRPSTVELPRGTCVKTQVVFTDGL